MNLYGYEWRYECPKCETHHELSGMMADEKAIVNGEKEYRRRLLEEGDVLTCANCGYKSKV